MFTFVILLLMSRMSSGFLLDSKNSSILVVKPTYLTVSEYYGDKNQIHHDLENIQKLLHQEQQTLHQEQETLHQQHESYRHQQEKMMNLLTTQLQQKFDLIEKKLAAQTSNNDTEVIEALVKKNQVLENKYSTIQRKLTAKENMYNEIAENYTKLQEAMATQDKNTANLQQDLRRIQTKCDAEINVAVNKSLDLEQKIRQLEQLQSIKQLQTLQTLQGQVQTFDSRINLLTSHEQARNQDFLALYNLTTSSKHELENKMNNQYKTIVQNQNTSASMIQQKQHQNFLSLYNLTTSSRHELETKMNNQYEAIAKKQNMSAEMLQQKQLQDFQILRNMTSESKIEIEQLGRHHNLSFSLFQKNLDKKLQKVVVTGCTTGSHSIPAGPLKFPDIKTSVGVSNLSSSQSTGKFTCQVPGYYHIVTTILSPDTHARIDIMKNSNTIHWQYMTGYVKDNNYYTPGTAAVALELKTNDNVWIKLYSTYNIYQSCLTIFKIN